MVQFVAAENGSYRVFYTLPQDIIMATSTSTTTTTTTTTTSTVTSTSTILTNHVMQPSISECNDPYCIYSRSVSNLREKYEDKIMSEAIDKNNLSILFFGSFLLQQELQILKLLGNKILEIHLTDYVYKNFMTNEKICLAIDNFMEYIIMSDFNIDLYIHTEPDKLKHSIIYQRRFDIICGIDIDSIEHYDNRQIMKEIATNNLKLDGAMIISQNTIDLVDLCRYELDDQRTIKLISTEDYVKDPYFINYKIQNMICNIFSYLDCFGRTNMDSKVNRSINRLNDLLK